jgi:hypothetical protein
MLDPVLDHKPRGFTGRPLIALAFAVVMGFFGSDILRSRMHLNRLSAFVILISIVVIVHYVWYWAEKPK